MASISANGSKGHHKFTLNVTETGTDTNKNTSTVSFSFVLSSLGGGYSWEYSSIVPVTYSITINGNSYSGNIMTYDGNSSVTIRSGSITVPHNTDGTKSISFSFSVSSINEYYLTGSASASGSMALTKIPRYLSITSFEVTNKTETSIVVKWAVSDPRSGTYYSFDNGATWIGSATYGETLASDNKSGTFNILDLKANTNYNLKIRIRRTDSGLWTESGQISFTTYNYPHCTSSPNFTIGDALTLDFYNPLSRNITVKGYSKSTGGEVFSGTTNGTRLIGFNDDNTKNNLYYSIPASQSSSYKVVVSYGNVAMTRDAGNTYKIRGNEIPTINGFDYIDNNSSTVAITGNNQHIVQNKSKLLARFHSATPNYWASGISKYTLVINGKTTTVTKEGSYDLGTIDSANNLSLTLTATDSRGLSASKSITITMLAYGNPTATVTLQRLNNYEDETYLTVDGEVFSVNSKNTMKIEYRYRETGGTYGSFVTIDDGEKGKQTLTLDKNKSFDFNIRVTDAFGSFLNKTVVLGKGVFPLFIDTEKNSVGINCFPAEDKSLEVNGFNLFNVYKCCKNILLGSNAGLKITVNNFANSDKIPIIVVGADNSSMTPVFTVIHLRSGSGFGHINLGLNSTVTRNGKDLHITAGQWSYFTVFAPLGADITLSNSAL